MLTLVLSSVRHNLGRYLATLIAIITGVGFYTAVGVLSDGVISSLEGNVDAEYGNVDVAVVPDDERDRRRHRRRPETLKVPQATVDQLLAAAGGRRRRRHPDRLGRVPRRRRQAVRRPRQPVGCGSPTTTSTRSTSTDGDAPTARARSRSTAASPRTRTSRSGDDLTLLTLAGKQKVTLVGHHRVRRHRRHRHRRHRLDQRGRRLRLAQQRAGGVRVLLPAGVRRPGRPGRRGRHGRPRRVRGPDRGRVPRRPARVRPGRSPRP